VVIFRKEHNRTDNNLDLDNEFLKNLKEIGKIYLKNGEKKMNESLKTKRIDRKFGLSNNSNKRGKLKSLQENHLLTR
jgi:hypothetical protein